MADIPASNWDETDANNDDAAPDGFPEGMAPSGVNNGARAIMGAVKRFWNRINAVKTTGGTTSAYTLSYDVAPAAYVNGEIISFVVNAANAAAATINVNALGAKALRLFGGNLLAGALVADQIVQARYDSAAGAFDIIPQHGWVRLGSVNPSAAAAIDFTSIPAGVAHLMITGQVRCNTNNVGFDLQTYGADGVLDTGASDYSWANFNTDTSATTGAVADFADNQIVIANNVSSTANSPPAFTINASNIQSARYTTFTYQAFWLNQAGIVAVSNYGSGARNEADRITGVRLIASSGTLGGAADVVTIYGSAG
jgi:hypothetical protein